MATRFAASLAVGTARKPQTLAVDGVLFATACARPHRPIRMESGAILLFNGHIGNRRELRRELGSHLADDPALYAAARALWGDAADLRVIGEYCAILCDPAARLARLVRAPLAGPPLHYYHDAERLIVASTPRAIFATGAVRQEIDEQKIADSLFLNYTEGERSFLKGIARLRTATRLAFTPGGMRRETYYDLAALSPVRLKSDRDYVEAADALFEEGTRAALDGFAKPAVSISGGFDSQAVAAYALRVMPPERRLLGLTAVPEVGWDGRESAGRFSDESAHVRAFAAMHPRFDMETIDAAGLPLDHHLQNTFLFANVPPRNPMNFHWLHALRATAKARGCDVVLSGANGNVGFSFDGQGVVAGMIGRGRWIAAARELHAARTGRSLPRKFLSAAMAFAPEWLWRHADRYFDRYIDVFEGYCPLNRAYAAEMRVAERAAAHGFDPQWRPPRNSLTPRLRMLGNAMQEAGDIRQGFELLHGIPMRDPAGWRPLLEFCLSIPDDQYRRGGVDRLLARRLLRGMVPDIVLAERRRGLQSADWYLRLGRQRAELRAEIDRLAEDPAMAHRFDLPSLRTALDDLPTETPVEGAPLRRLNLALNRAIATTRFIRYVEGGNS